MGARWRICLSVAVALSGAATACEDPLTQLVVAVDTDLQVPAEIDSIQIRVTGPTSQAADVHVALAGPDARRLPTALTLVPAEGSVRGPITIRVEGRLGEAPVVERTARTMFVAGESRLLRLILSRRCVGMTMCPTDQSCGASGACESIDVPESELAPWTGTIPTLTDGGTIGGDATGGDSGEVPVDGGGVPDSGGTDGWPPCSLGGVLCADLPCEGTVFGDHCYEYHPMAWTLWTGGADDCEISGGYLATISSAAENTMLATLIRGEEAWIGLHYDAGVSTWITGEPVVFEMWTPPHPTIIDNGCAVIYGAGGWWTQDCNVAYRANVCERPSWTVFAGHTYRVFLLELDWSAARSDCITRGGTLASITSAEEGTFLMTLARSNRVFWIGGTDVGREGAFEWTGGDAWGYENYAPREPDDPTGTEDCLAADGSSGQWSDRVCTERRGYICERAP